MRQNTVYADLGGGSILQYATRGPYQGMGYLIETPDKKIVMIDGGRLDGDDAVHTHSLIAERGHHVDLWIITHAHSDHFGALSEILRRDELFDIEIDELRFSFPPTEWFKDVENGESYGQITEFLELVQKRGIKTGRITESETIVCGGVVVEVISDARDYSKYSSINDTSVVFKVKFPRREILFLGDLGKDAADELLARVEHDKLRSDIVQMAHHGQNGAGRNFYEVAKPKIALYCAPLWLWDCDIGGGVGSGPWKTLETRSWLREIGVQISCPHAYGDYLLI